MPGLSDEEFEERALRYLDKGTAEHWTIVEARAARRRAAEAEARATTAEARVAELEAVVQTALHKLAAINRLKPRR